MITIYSVEFPDGIKYNFMCQEFMEEFISEEYPDMFAQDEIDSIWAGRVELSRVETLNIVNVFKDICDVDKVMESISNGN